MDENEVNVQREDALRDALIERLRDAGIDVVTDYKEGERVLQQENSKAGFIPDLSHVDGDTLDYSLMEDVNAQRSSNNHHFISDRNQLTMEEKETQQKAWRAVFHSLSEGKSSSEMPRHTNVPGTSYSASKPIDGANIGKISRIYDQLNNLLREINNKDLTREQFTNILAGSLGLRLDKDKVSRYSDEPVVLRNGEKISLRISNHPALSVNFVRWKNNDNSSYGFVLRDGSRGRFDDDHRVNHLEIDYYRDSIDQATTVARRDLYRDIVNGIKFMLEEGSLEMMPFPDHLNASGVFKKPLEEFRKEHPEMLFHQEVSVKSEAFRQWFGDSKVVDGNGEPLVVFHGTNNDDVKKHWNEKTRTYDTEHKPFEEFDIIYVDGLPSVGHFFVDKQENAEGYGNTLYPVYLSMQNPLVIDCKGADYYSIEHDGESHDTYEWAAIAMERGHDGVIFKNIHDGVDFGSLQEPVNEYVVFSSNQIKSVNNIGTFRKESRNIYEHIIEDAPSELATILSGGISREEVEEAYNSKLVQRWIKANNSNEESTKKGFDLFGIGPSLIHEFARGRLGIDNRYDPGSNVFFNSWDWLGEYLRAAKENGLSPAIADKYDLRFGSDDVKHIQEHPDAIFTDAEMEEIEKHMKPKGFEDFKAVLRSFSEAEKVKAEEERIKGYEGGDALTKAFMLWKIALSRLKAEHYGDSRWFFKQRTWHAPDGSHGILTSNQKIRPGETEGFTYDLKSDVAKRIMYMIATSPIAEKLPLLEAGVHAMPSVSDPSEEVRFMLAPDQQQPIFISNAMMALDKIKQDKATPYQWLKMLDKFGGIKMGEDRWTGLSQWLRDSEAKSLTKTDVSDYLRKNMIQVKEVHYMNSDDIEKTDSFKRMNEEFRQKMKEADDLYDEADRDYEAFMDEMYEKYGDEWSDMISSDEYNRETELLRRRESYSYTNDEIAFREMIKQYGDDFEIAFGCDGSNLEVANEDYATDLLDLPKFINSTRMEYSTDCLENKHEIALTVPAVESYNRDDDLHFGDADKGTAIGWIRFGDMTVRRAPSEAELAARVAAMPKASDWEKVDGSNFVVKKDCYFLPGTRNQSNHSFIVDNGNGIFEIGGPMARKMLNIRYPSLEEAVAAFSRTWVKGRTNDFSEKILVIDEIQSKRHQDAREKGYMPSLKERDALRHEHDSVNHLIELLFDDAPEDVKYDTYGRKFWALENLSGEAYQRFCELDEKRRNLKEEINHFKYGELVPDAPFEKNWQELCMKRMLRYAAENGYDKVAWTNGNIQAERYSLDKVLNTIESGKWTTDDEADDGRRYKQDSKSLVFYTNDTEFSVDINRDGRILASDFGELRGKQLSEVIGKELSAKIIKDPSGSTYNEEQLRIGGDGMKGFYDQILPRFVNKYCKQWGVHVEDMGDPFLSNEDKKRNPSLCSFGYHSVSITDQMKRDVMAGQPMFLRNGDHQAYGFVFNGTIYLDPRVATAETPIHEYTHLWAEVLRQRNPKEWDHIVTMMKDIPQLWEHVEQSYAARWKVQLEKGLLTQKEYDYRVADEVLAQFSGKRGYEKLSAFADGQKDGKGIFDAMLEILKEFWNRVSEFFGVHYLDKEQVADRVLYDLLQGVNPLDYKREDIQGLREAQAEAESAVREDGGVPVVIPRTDLSEHDIRTAERAARTAVIERITDYGARSLSDEQRGVISHYRAMFTSDTSTGELYNRLLESVLDDPEVRRCPREWAQAAAEELQDMAVGKVHSEEENIGFKR